MASHDCIKYVYIANLYATTAIATTITAGISIFPNLQKKAIQIYIINEVQSMITTN